MQPLAEAMAAGDPAPIASGRRHLLTVSMHELFSCSASANCLNFVKFI
jgi:hypothetical protein